MIKKFNEFVKEFKENKYPTKEDIDDHFLRLKEVLNCEILRSPLFLAHTSHTYFRNNPFYGKSIDVFNVYPASQNWDPDFEEKVYSEIDSVVNRMESMYDVDIEVMEVMNSYNITIKKRDSDLQEHYYYIDSINESFSINDIGSYLRKVFDRISKASKEHKHKILLYALTTLLLTSTPEKIFSVISSDPSIKSKITPDLQKTLYEKLLKTEFKDPTSLSVSQKCWNQIRMEEGNPKHPGEPVLKAYEIGDGKITIGWGHSEPIKTSKFKIGQKISIEEAQKLFKKDMEETANGVRRIFKEWKNEGVNRKITQDMFDALVSISFNTGIGSLRSSEIIKELKKGNYEKAGKIIKSTNTNDDFGGLSKRRESESKLFLTFLQIPNFKYNT